MSTSTKLAGKTAWVVGASSGIGAALANELHARGVTVAISARRREQLEEVSAGRMTVVEADVTDRDGMDSAYAQVRAAVGPVDLVILNAGFWEQMDVTAWDREVFARHVEVNLLGMNNGVGAVLPDLLERGSGHIVGVASVAGYRGISGAEAYGPTKAAQINLLESLRAGLSRRGIAVTTVCPGFVRTPLTDDNDFPMPFMIEAQEAAESICNGLERGQQEIVFPARMAVVMKLARLLPVRVWTAVMSRAVKN